MITSQDTTPPWNYFTLLETIKQNPVLVCLGRLPEEGTFRPNCFGRHWFSCGFWFSLALCSLSQAADSTSSDLLCPLDPILSVGRKGGSPLPWCLRPLVSSQTRSSCTSSLNPVEDAYFPLCCPTQLALSSQLCPLHWYMAWNGVTPSWKHATFYRPFS